MGTVTSTPYDDVFRTMLNDCVELIIPVINEAFEEHYSGQERIVFSQNEHFINKQDGEEEKRITDSCFTIIGDVEKKYLCECQSTPDNSMLVRVFEYVTQVALDQGEVSGNELEVRFPNRMIREMANKVLENIAVKYKNVRKGVGTVMGGKVLEYEAKTIFQNGRRQGIQDGKAQEIFVSVQEQDYSVERGAEKLGVSVEEFEKQMKMAGFEIPVMA